MPLCLMHDAEAPSASGLIVFGCGNEAGTVFGEASGVLDVFHGLVVPCRIPRPYE